MNPFYANPWDSSSAAIVKPLIDVGMSDKYQLYRAFTFWCFNSSGMTQSVSRSEHGIPNVIPYQCR
jgi:hypothetical protein